MFKSGNKAQSVENAGEVQIHEKFKKKTLIYLLFASFVLIVMMVQAILIRYIEVLSDTTDSNLLDKIKRNCIIQAVAAPCMIILQLIACKISSRSSKFFKQLKFFRLILQLGYNELSLEASVIPMGNTGSVTYSSLSAILFIELLFLSLGSMVIEPPSIASVFPFAFTNIMTAARLLELPIDCMILFILTVLALGAGIFQECSNRKAV